MCKIAVIPVVKADKKSQINARRLIFALTPLLSKFNSDGFGIMSYGDKGLFTERWLDNKDAFKHRAKSSSKLTSLVNEYLGAIVAPKGYSCEGTVNTVIKSVALHARTATCEKTLQNTHPFRAGNTALIHNGVVDKTGLTFKTSTCDSEGILNKYIEANVNSNIQNIDEMSYDLAGYYACAVFSHDKADRPILDIFKDDKATLFAGYVAEIDGMVFSTSGEDIREACVALKWNKPTIMQVADNTIVRIDVLSGTVIAAYEFESNGYDYVETSKLWDKFHARTSGKELTEVKLDNRGNVVPVDVAFQTSSEGYRAHSDDDGGEGGGYAG